MARPRGVAEFTKTVAKFTKSSLAGQKPLQYPKIIVSLRLRLEDRLHLGNKNKSKFILYFARFALSLHPETYKKQRL